MKILRASKPFGDWRYEHICACGCHFEMTLDDLDYDALKVSGYHFDNSAVFEWKLTYKCPSCENRYDMPSKAVPAGWLRQKERNRGR